MTQYQSPLLELPGATEFQAPPEATVHPDAFGVAWHYGDPLGEQRLIENHPVWIDRSHRRVFRISGPDSATFLNNLLSQKLDDAPVGFYSPALDLDMQGHIQHHLDVLRAADDSTDHTPCFLIHTTAAQADTLYDFLHKMIFWSKVSIEMIDAGVITLIGEDVQKLLDVPSPGILGAASYSWTAHPRMDLFVARHDLRHLAQNLEAQGITRAGLMAFSAERVRALEPELSVDLDHRSIPHEVPHWIGRGIHPGAVHLNKGCYRGQETVARVENLGRSPRVAVLLQLDGSAPREPLPGMTVQRGNRTVGRVGTIVHDCDFGPIAFALIKRSALGTSDLHIGDTAVAVDPTSLPQDEGPRAGRAAVDRLRGL
ncbi:folate-binding protein [Corynebacterium poyangense]|uniref:Folate-binding protein n=1 Tax=Corynebacterium poyangense TaxID=2684405 RepID=A0A7H0SQY2_9CORY|nr:folate-binding protein YgfZ [Corynebacterium poyangense]MBZ8176374.1 folate-binding protein [Corynebacterium poyangense]QNQ90957.1 folate-binding protein [Corynebacterium poyangense]